jgi:quercetin dioxygenase-like cupin family protein
MQHTTINRPYDSISEKEHNVSWTLLSRKKSSQNNITIAIQRFEPGGFFSNHAHDLEQYFYVTHGRFEMTISGETRILAEGDFVIVDRNQSHSGRNIDAGASELLFVDYFSSEIQSKLGLD